MTKKELHNKMSKAAITNAWNLARKAAKQFGGKAKDFFSESLKLAWSFVKKLFKKDKVVATIIDRVNNLESFFAEEYNNVKTGVRRVHIFKNEEFNGYFEIESTGAVSDHINYNLSRIDRINLLATCVNI